MPGYVKATIMLLGLFLAGGLLLLGRDVFVPLAFAALLSVLLHPLSDLFERHRVPRLLSITLAVTIACIVILALGAVIAMQLGQFGEQLPRLQRQGAATAARLQAYISGNWGVTSKDQLEWLSQWTEQAWQRGATMLGQALWTIMDITSIVVLVPLYAFLMLMYQDLLLEFVYRVFAGRNMATLEAVLQETRTVVKSYVVGLIFETVIIAILNSAALLLLGVDYAILFGIIAALLNLIPYIGILVGGLLPLLMALITKDSMWYPIGVTGAITFIQFLDNNLIVPYIVASRVSINAIVSIIAVIVGGMLWGISGMFLSLPAVAILKIVFDRVENLKPWGLLLGDVIPPARAHSLLPKD